MATKELMKVEEEVYFCAFCRVQFTDTYCIGCNRYDGAIEASEWNQMLKEGF